nr:condensin-2 complex subunit D3 [Tanacetum cinerariifolium]
MHSFVELPAEPADLAHNLLKRMEEFNMHSMETAPSLYIQAWLTTGKICLADDKLAKRYIPLFVQEMENSNDAALRNNIIVMMADF